MNQLPFTLSNETRLMPYAVEELNNGKYLLTGYFGGWVFISNEEFYLLKSQNYFSNFELNAKLKNAGILINNRNMKDIIDMYRNLNGNFFLKPTLHMINVTNTCNYRCRYCHAGVSQGKDFMSEKTALKVLKFIFKSGGPCITIEFQGGECLLNWKVVKLVIEKSRLLNKTFNKNLHICIVSNLSLINEEKLNFLIDHEVSICTSLDGTKEVHDNNRKSVSGDDTYNTTISKIRFITDYYKKHGLDKKIDALATITRSALSSPKAIVDEYVSLGIKNLHLRPVQNLGDALNKWPELAYSTEEFYRFWVESMEHILDLNKKGVDILERGAYNILCKILDYRDPLYVELMNPTGMGRSTLLYNFDGAIYNSDEGRMIPEPIFRIGNVDEDVMDVLGSKENITSWVSSFLDLSAYNSAFRPWGGIHPVHIYHNQGTVIPNLSNYDFYKIYCLQCKFLFEKIAENGFEKEIFMKWTKKVIR